MTAMADWFVLSYKKIRKSVDILGVSTGLFAYFAHERDIKMTQY